MKKPIRIIFIIIAAILLFFVGVRLFFRLPVSEYYKRSEKAFVIPEYDKGFIAQGLSYSPNFGMTT